VITRSSHFMVVSVVGAATAAVVSLLLASLMADDVGAAPPLPVAPLGCVLPDAGRVALWRAEGTAEDTVQGLDGSSDRLAYAAGVVGEAFDLPGDGDHVTVPAAAALDITADLTLDTWVKIDDTTFGAPDAHGIGGDRALFWKVDSTDRYSTYAFWIEANDHTAANAPLTFFHGDREQAGSHAYSDGLAWEQNRWYHVAAVRSGRDITFYRDGQPVGSGALEQDAAATPGAPLALGAAPLPDAVYHPLKGGLDEVGIWDRALGADEVKAIHDTATGACMTPPQSPPSSEPSTADTMAPDTTITSGPANGSSAPDTAIAYGFVSSEPGSTFECRSYSGPAGLGPMDSALLYAPCGSPFTVAAMTKPGINVFQVRAVDAAGNKDATPARRRMINHGRFGPPAKPSRCRMVAVDRDHGKRLVPGCRLARITHGKVRCVNVETAKSALCRYTRRSGRVLETKTGPDYAMAGESISRSGNRRGRWIVASKRSSARTVPCVKSEPRVKRADTSGRIASGVQLAGTCIVEELGASWNALSVNGPAPLINYATLEVCSSNNPAINPHPDGATLTRVLPDGGGWCYKGYGAGLNDLNGAERDWRTEYYGGEQYCHVIVSGGLEVPAAKRPATKSLPAPGRVNPKTPILWRPVNPDVEIANNGDPAPEPTSSESEPISEPVEAPPEAW
jgi:hypothetical protein